MRGVTQKKEGCECMAEKKKNTKKTTNEERIKAEISRLNNIYKTLPEKEYKTAEKLINNIAFMSVTLEDLMEIVNKERLVKRTKNASQSFVKEHPALTAYNKMYANFLKGLQQLSSLLPKNYGDTKPVEDNDDFIDFLRNKN